MAVHDKVCLLKNTRIALLLTLVFVGFGVLDVLSLANLMPVAPHDPALPYLLVGAVALGVILLRSFTCLAERAILGLMMVSTLFNLLAVTQPHLFSGIVRNERMTGAAVSFTCAIISGFAAFRGLARATR